MTASSGMSGGRGGNGDCCAARLTASASNAIPVIFKEASRVEDSKRSTRHRRAHDKTSRSERGILSPLRLLRFQQELQAVMSGSPPLNIEGRFEPVTSPATLVPKSIILESLAYRPC